MSLPVTIKIKKIIAANEDMQQFTEMLNQQPPAEWIKIHPFVKGYRYLPIDKIETLLKAIFQQWRIEITGQGESFNGVWVTVRVHFLHPVTSEWSFHDGIGASQLQTAKGKSASDFSAINNGALSMAYPLAKTVAIKDACDHFGELFGANLNRRDLISFDQAKDEVNFLAGGWEYVSKLLDEKSELLNEKELAYAQRIVQNREKTSYKKLSTFLEGKQ